MKKGRIIRLAIALVIFGAGFVWGGLQRGTEEILYQRLDGIDMPEDSIAMVMALPRSLITDWETKGIGCATYLEVAPAVAAAAIIVVKGDCFERKVLFNYTHLQRGKK